ncbi:hypothetical protein M1D47_15615 [Bacillus sp. R1-10]
MYLRDEYSSFLQSGIVPIIGVLTILAATALTLLHGKKFIAQLLVKPNTGTIDYHQIAPELPPIHDTEGTHINDNSLTLAF